jgi:hypothetical protein
LCDDLTKQDFVELYSVRCWIAEFKKYLEKNTKAFPITDPATFDTEIKKWIELESEDSGSSFA